MSKIAVVFNSKKISKSRLETFFPGAQFFKTGELAKLEEFELAEFDLCVVAGGDGTLRSVVQYLMENHIKIPIGIIPVGTGNILARNLRIPMDIKGASKIALAGNYREIDLGKAKVGSEPAMFFTGISGLGLDASIMENTHPKLKKRIGWVAYIEGGIRSLPPKFEKFEVTVDNNETKTLKVLTLIVANTGTLPGKFSLLPDAEVDDGNLDVAAIGPRKIWNWIDVLGRILWQNRFIRPLVVGRKLMDATSNLKSLEYLSGKKITVVSERESNFQLDGDLMKPAKKVTFQVLPKALLVACK